MDLRLKKLVEAEEKARILFDSIEKKGIIRAGISEKELNIAIYNLAFDLFGIKKYWHKRIVRGGKNTLLPYKENPPIFTLEEDDIVFLDFGPVFDEWEADFGRTYVIGANERKLKLKQDVELAWYKGYEHYKANETEIRACDMYHFTCDLARKMGWEYGNVHCGHLVGEFPHEKVLGDEIIHYLHPENISKLADLDQLGNKRHWIYEIHFIDQKLEIGGFYEQLMV